MLVPDPLSVRLSDSLPKSCLGDPFRGAFFFSANATRGDFYGWVILRWKLFLAGKGGAPPLNNLKNNVSKVPSAHAQGSATLIKYVKNT